MSAWGFHENWLACLGVHTRNSHGWHMSCLASAGAGYRKNDVWGEAVPKAPT